MRKLITNNYLLSTLSLILAAIGSGLSIYNDDFTWLSRFGALIICAGIMILARPAILGEDIKTHVYMAETDLSDLHTEHYKKAGDPVPDWVIEVQRSRTATGWLGPLICHIGTATNGFADLLNIAFGY